MRTFLNNLSVSILFCAPLLSGCMNSCGDPFDLSTNCTDFDSIESPATGSSNSNSNLNDDEEDSVPRGIADNGGYNDFFNSDETALLYHFEDFVAIHGTLLQDSSGANLSGLMTTNDGTTAKIATGIVDQGLHFDGVDDTIDFTNGVNGLYDETETTFSYAFWVKPTVGTINDAFFSVGADSCSAGGLAITGYDQQPSGNDKALVEVRVGTNGILVNELDAGHPWAIEVYKFPLNEWTHVAVVVNEIDVLLYVNGELVTISNNWTGRIRILSTNAIGFGACGADHFKGYLDEYTVFNKILSADQVAAIYNNSRPSVGTEPSVPTLPFTADLLVNISYDDPTGWLGSGNGGPVDNSGNGNDAVTSGRYDLQMPGKWGAGAAVDMENGGGYEVSNEPAFDFTINDSFTIMTWLKTSISGAGNDSGIFGKLINCHTPGYIAQISTDHALSGSAIFHIHDGIANGTQVYTGVALNDGQWHHLVATYDGSLTQAGMKVYVDGVDVTTVIDGTPTIAPGTNILNDQPLVFGAAGDNNCNPAKGLIDESAVYTRALTPAEISAIYTVQAAKTTLYPKREGCDSGTTAVGRFTNWDYSEPNDDGGAGENCIQQWGPTSAINSGPLEGGWNDAQCTTAQRYACKNSDGDWQITAATGIWEKGEAACEALPGDYTFAIPSGSTLAAFQADNTALDTARLAYLPEQSVWINGTDEYKEGFWCKTTPSENWVQLANFPGIGVYDATVKDSWKDGSVDFTDSLGVFENQYEPWKMSDARIATYNFDRFKVVYSARVCAEGVCDFSHILYFRGEGEGGCHYSSDTVQSADCYTAYIDEDLQIPYGEGDTPAAWHFGLTAGAGVVGNTNHQEGALDPIVFCVRNFVVNDWQACMGRGAEDVSLKIFGKNL